MLPRQMPQTPAKTPGPLSQRAAAKKLGVSLWHLNRVLRGHRASKRLLARYTALQAASAATPTA